MLTEILFKKSTGHFSKFLSKFTLISFIKSSQIIRTSILKRMIFILYTLFNRVLRENEIKRRECHNMNSWLTDLKIWNWLDILSKLYETDKALFLEFNLLSVCNRKGWNNTICKIFFRKKLYLSLKERLGVMVNRNLFLKTIEQDKI